MLLVVVLLRLGLSPTFSRTLILGRKALQVEGVLKKRRFTNASGDYVSLLTECHSEGNFPEDRVAFFVPFPC